MALCGFNQKMLDGLTAFSEGLIEHGLIYRSKINHETSEQAISREISDMTRLLSNITCIDSSEKRILTEGLVKYAMGVYLLMRTKEITEYKDVIRGISEYFKFMDDKYYSELEGKPNDMKHLCECLSQKDVCEHCDAR